MNKSVGFIYGVLITVFVISSCVLFIIVAADLQKGQAPTNKSEDPFVGQENVVESEGLVNTSEEVDISNVKANSAADEIRGSFDDLSVSSLKENVKTSEEFLQPTGFKYTSIQDGLSESGEGVMVTLMEQGLMRGSEAQNASAAPVEDKGGGPPPPGAAPPENATEDQHQPHDDIPSFSEWTKKQIAEAEKNKAENLTISGGGSGSGMKVRSKNYASPDCGAKVISSNPEAISPGSVLSTSRDEYILSPCDAKTWFIVELCESIQPQRIEVANFELFSSSPKDFSVHISDRYPTREWTHAVTITAKDERTVQSFPLPHLPQFAKFVKIELHSHYGTEHYCPLSLFRAYGTSELEVLETVEEASGGAEEEDDLVGGAGGEDGAGNEMRPQNLFGSARAAVLSIVKKAAEVLVVKSQSNTTCKETNTSVSQAGNCVTPGYLLVCHNCTDNFFYRVYHLLCCHQGSLQSLLGSPFVSKVLSDTNLCSGIGLEWPQRGAPLPLRPRTSRNRYSPMATYLQALFPKEKIAALCNMLAVSHKKVVLNVSHDGNIAEMNNKEKANESLSTSIPTVVSEVSSETPSIPMTNLTPQSSSAAIPISEAPSLTSSSSASSVPPSVDPPISAQIKPTKTLTEEDPPRVSEQSNATVILQQAETQVQYAASSQTDTEVNINQTVESNTVPETKETIEEGVENSNISDPVNNIEVESNGGEERRGEENSTTDPLGLDSLDFPELEEETESTVTAKATATPAQQYVQKESVFVRLANRIKALERNMSLSGQYLEELSRRYKKQVEELQRTLSSMLEERRLSSERENLQAAQLSILTHRVETLTSAISDLIMERESWTNKASLIGQHGVIILVEVVVFVIVMSICRWVGGNQLTSQFPQTKLAPIELPRRKSLDDIKPPQRPMKRRPSEEALRVAGGAHNDLLIDGVRKTSKGDGGKDIRKRKRRRKEQQRNEIGGLGGEVGGGETAANGGAVLLGGGESENGGGQIVMGPPPPLAVPAPPPPPPIVIPSPAPSPSPSSSSSYIRTALWSRKQRVPSSQQQTSSSQETVSNPTPTKPHKKPGPLKKIVRKLF